MRESVAPPSLSCSLLYEWKLHHNRTHLNSAVMYLQLLITLPSGFPLFLHVTCPPLSSVSHFPPLLSSPLISPYHVFIHLLPLAPSASPPSLSLSNRSSHFSHRCRKTENVQQHSFFFFGLCHIIYQRLNKKIGGAKGGTLQNHDLTVKKPN